METQNNLNLFQKHTTLQNQIKRHSCANYGICSPVNVGEQFEVHAPPCKHKRLTADL